MTEWCKLQPCQTANGLSVGVSATAAGPRSPAPRVGCLRTGWEAPAGCPNPQPLQPLLLLRWSSALLGLALTAAPAAPLNRCLQHCDPATRLLALTVLAWSCPRLRRR